MSADRRHIPMPIPPQEALGVCESDTCEGEITTWSTSIVRSQHGTMKSSATCLECGREIVQ